MLGNVKRVVAGALLLMLVATTLAGTASARPTPERGVSRHGRQALYAQELHRRLQAEARFYASTSSTTDGGSLMLGYALVGCLILLAGAGAAAAWRFERQSVAPAVSALQG